MGKSKTGKFQIVFVAGLLSLLGASSAMAEEAEAEEVLVAANTPDAKEEPNSVLVSPDLTPPLKQLWGNIELRPSWTTRVGEIHGENSAELGYKFTPDLNLSYCQDLTTQFYDPTKSEDQQGFSLNIQRSFLRLRANNLWVDKANGLTLFYQNRWFIPNNSADRAMGFIAVTRNYINLKKQISDTVAFTVSEIPIFQFFSKPGSFVGGSAVANPAFENRVYLTTDIQLSKSLFLSIPVMFHQTKIANYSPDAPYNDQWTFTVWTYPELDYYMDNNKWYLGLAYYSDNLVTPKLTKFNVAQGLERGIFQFVMGANL